MLITLGMKLMIKEKNYKLRKELWAFTDNKIAVRFEYEYQNAEGAWIRAYGNENWEFNENGLMRRRYASINDLPIRESERKYFWPLGRRPDGHGRPRSRVRPRLRLGPAPSP